MSLRERFSSSRALRNPFPGIPNTHKESTLVWGCSKLPFLLLLRITDITQLSPWLWAVGRAQALCLSIAGPQNLPSIYRVVPQSRADGLFKHIDSRRLSLCLFFYLTCLSLFLSIFSYLLFFSSHPSLPQFFMSCCKREVWHASVSRFNCDTSAMI